jgi:hypothetical protein
MIASQNHLVFFWICERVTVENVMGVSCLKIRTTSSSALFDICTRVYCLEFRLLNVWNGCYFPVP